MGHRSFGSDNHSGVHPQIMAALQSVNVDHAHSYGLDPLTLETEKLFQAKFKTDLRCFFVFNGTGCNVVGLRGLVKPYESVLCAVTSHLNEDECAAPEITGGFKLVPVATQNGKIDLQKLEDHLQRGGDQHFAQPKVISITQPTEFGTTYSQEELKQLRTFCDTHNLYLHVDGARFTNSLHFLKIDFHDFIQLCRPDVISMGGTKNGLMFGEALLVFRPELFEAYKFLRKQSMQLPSKGRFIAAQFNALLTNDLYKNIAQHSHEMARHLAGLLQAKGLRIEYPVESNAVFTCFPKGSIKKLRSEYFFYVWDEKTFLSRLMCSFDTTKEEIERFVQLMP